MTRPAFQFYPADWRANIKLRRCSEAARGVWVDIMCTLHDSDEYGVLRWPLADIVQAAGVKLKYARELADKGVLKGADSGCQAYIFTPRHAGQAGTPVTLIEATDGPCWYCSRMVRDEYIRSRRGSATRFDAENQPPKQTPIASPKHPIGDGEGDGPSSSSSSSSSSSKKHTPPNPPLGGSTAGGNPDAGKSRSDRANNSPDLFAHFWAAYPRKVSKPQAVKAWNKLSPDENLLALILAGIARDKRSPQWIKDDGQFIPHPATWLNGQRWEDGGAGDLLQAQQTVSDWWTAAGFGTQWEAENAGCYAHTAKRYRNGVRIVEAVQ